MQRQFHVIALPQFCDHHFDVLLPRARKQKFLRLRVAAKTQRQILFEDFVDGHADPVFIRAGFRLDRKGDRRLGNARRRIKDRRTLVAQGIAGDGFLQLGDGADVARRAGRSLPRQSCLASLARAESVPECCDVKFVSVASFFSTPDITLK